MSVSGGIGVGGDPAAMPEPRDEELVSRMLSGDEAALSTLYRRHVGPIYRYVLAQVRHVQDAEDLTADTFARMLRGIRQFRGEASFRNWLYQIARNAVRNHRRSARYRLTAAWPRSGVPLADAPPVLDETPDAAAGPDPRLLEVLRRLPPRYRAVLELRFLEGMSIERTAEAMAVTVSNAKVLQHRALHKAAQIVEEGAAIELRSDQR